MPFSEEAYSAYVAGHQLGSPLTYAQWLSNYVKTNVGVHKHPIKIRYTYPPPGSTTSIPAGYEQAALYFDFTQNAGRLNGTWGPAVPLLTCTRASVAQGDTSAGWWGQFAANAPRWSDKGLLVEEARTNSIRNNTMVGAVAGSPGTMPTNWQVSGSGLAATVVAVGNELGVDYVDIRVSGTTASTSGVIFFDNGTTQIAALNADIWAISAFVKLIAGSTANITATRLVVRMNDGGGVNLASVVAVTDMNPTLNTTLTRYAGTVTLNQATTAFVMPQIQFNWASGVAVDITLRIGWPQLEKGGFATSPIKTSTVAVTRAADLIDVASFVPTNPASLFAEVMLPGFMAGTYCGAILISGAVPDNDRQSLIVFGTNLQGILDCTVGTVNQANLLGGSATAGQPFKYAGATAVNDFALSTNGAAVLTDTAGSLVAAPTKIVIGRAFASTFFANSYIRRVAYWDTRRSNAFLTAITGGTALPVEPVLPPGFEQAQMYMDFTANQGWFQGNWTTTPALLTTARASVAQMDNSAGVWTEFAANQPRVSDKGILIEEVRTNSIRNNTMVGAVAGSPGTLPTNWAQIGGIPGGLTRTIVGVGNEQGIDYIDIQYAGVGSSSFGVIDFEQTAAAVAGQDWTNSFFYKLAAGSLTNFVNLQSVVTQLGGAGQTAITLPSLTNTWQRGVAWRNMPASTTFAIPRLVFNYTTGQPIDFTLRIGWPQLEQGAFVTSPIKTSTVALTRPADSVTVTTVPTITGNLTMFSEQVANLKDNVTNGVSMFVSDGTLNNCAYNYLGGVNGKVQGTITSGTSQFNGNPGPAYPNGAIAKTAMAFALNDGQNAVGGIASVVDTVLTMPVAMNAIRIGGINTVNSVINGYVRKIATWPSRLTDVQLQAITTP